MFYICISMSVARKMLRTPKKSKKPRNCKGLRCQRRSVPFLLRYSDNISLFIINTYKRTKNI